MKIERIKKIEKASMRIVARFLTEELPDNDQIFGVINLCEVRFSTDASYLDIVVSCFENQDLLTKTLAKYAYIIQAHIGKEMGMRKNPRVRFRYDNSGEISQRIGTEILHLDIEDIERKIELTPLATL